MSILAYSKVVLQHILSIGRRYEMQKLRVDMNMGANLRRLRLEHRYTQDQLVAKLHLWKSL